MPSLEHISEIYLQNYPLLADNGNYGIRRAPDFHTLCSRGLRKLRVPLPGRGKRGGARVIYYHWVSKEQCYLLYAYAKNVSANLTSQQLQRLAEVMQAEIRDE